MANATLPRHSSRSEKMLQSLLVKDVDARSRSHSISSKDIVEPAPPLPVTMTMPAEVTRNSRSHHRNESSSGGSHDSSGDERPLFTANALLFRPPLPSPRKTHDGVLSPTPRRSHSPPPLPSRHQTAPLIHANSAPHIGEHHPSAAPEWSYEESSSPGSTSYMSSGCSSASHPPGTPQSSFNLQSATEYCRQQQGYVSFGEIEGLGWPAGEEEEERLERQRLEIEMKRKKGWWGWLEDGILTRPKTPANAQDHE